ncbi:hypothetical protein RYH80_18335 [Halobaculum sp. MBLA0147]|uniref:hypothetical protein n=1 Tax=Halobaculum sp. MBLA0147 TaxID=3079934 RepID=UPI003523FF38
MSQATLTGVDGQLSSHESHGLHDYLESELTSDELAQLREARCVDPIVTSLPPQGDVAPPDPDKVSGTIKIKPILEARTSRATKPQEKWHEPLPSRVTLTELVYTLSTATLTTAPIVSQATVSLLSRSLLTIDAPLTPELTDMIGRSAKLSPEAATTRPHEPSDSEVNWGYLGDVNGEPRSIPTRNDGTPTLPPEVKPISIETALTNLRGTGGHRISPSEMDCPTFEETAQTAVALAELLMDIRTATLVRGPLADLCDDLGIEVGPFITDLDDELQQAVQSSGDSGTTEASATSADACGDGDGGSETESSEQTGLASF